MIKLPGKRWLLQIGVVATLVLQGCTPSAPIASVGKPKLFPLAVRSDPVCDGQDPRGPFEGACTFEQLESLAFAAHGKESIFNMQGSGVCGEVSFDAGDGTPPQVFTNVSFEPAQPGEPRPGWQVRHTYTGWPGKKMVRVKGITNCLADSNLEIAVGFEPEGRENFRNVFRPTGMQCNPVMLNSSPPRAMPSIRKGSGVRIETDGGVINYGGPNIIFNASGDPTAAVPSGYLFPSHRKFSLVYRIGGAGGQLVQGEAGPVVFNAAQTGPLEVCVNDNPSFLTDNSGGMLVTITVNESSAE
ncbi:MAG TPA: hypothetical protein VJU83_01565 [Burkholderiales bacterium]|nr:hypothetical protein [Burkholderiales bacterium]